MYMPFWIEMTGKKVLVIGGGNVALRRAEALADAGASITLIAPKRVEGWQMPAVSWRKRVYKEGDLNGYDLVIAATDVPEVNEAVVCEGKENGIPVNDASKAKNGDVIFPASIREGGFAAALTSEGLAPFLIKRVKKDVAAVLKGYDRELLTALAAEREYIIEHFPEEKETMLKKMASLPLEELRDIIEKGKDHDLTHRLQRE